MARLLANRGDHEAAIGVLTNVPGNTDSDGQLEFLLSWELYREAIRRDISWRRRQERLARAADAVERLFEIQPANPEGRYLEALILSALNENEAAIERLRVEYDRLQNRIHAAYVDKLDGIIGAEFFEKMSAEWRADQDRCLRDIERHQSADQSYLEDGVCLIELAQNAQRLFAKQEAREKRRLLNFLVSNCSWQDGALSVTFRQPFDLIAETTAIDAKRKAAGEVSNGLSEIWLPGPDSNQRHGG